MACNLTSGRTEPCKDAVGGVKKAILCDYVEAPFTVSAGQATAINAGVTEVFQYDLRGHGKSGGERGYIDPFTQYMEDLDDCIKHLRDNYKMQNYIIYGHSMGALISCGHTQSFVKPEYAPKALIVNAPPVGVGGRRRALFPDRLAGPSVPGSLSTADPPHP